MRGVRLPSRCLCHGAALWAECLSLVLEGPVGEVGKPLEGESTKRLRDECVDRVPPAGGSQSGAPCQARLEAVDVAAL
jgi:hypothetical protein